MNQFYLSVNYYKKNLKSSSLISTTEVSRSSLFIINFKLSAERLNRFPKSLIN